MRELQQRQCSKDMKKSVASVGVALFLCAPGLRAEEPDGNYTFATKEQAMEKAQEMGCEGAYEWHGLWSPCEEDGGEDDHAGHNHSHGHSH